MLQRNLLTSLILYETIRTTLKRAKVIQPMMDRLITTAKNKEPREAIRALNAVVTHKNASHKLIEVLKLRYASRPSGYTRITPVGARQGDGAKMVDLELMDRDVATESDEPTKKPAKKVKKESTPAASK